MVKVRNMFTKKVTAVTSKRGVDRWIEGREQVCREWSLFQIIEVLLLSLLKLKALEVHVTKKSAEVRRVRSHFSE